nr:hypothetical protein [Candidatus Njordarchaeota archaeon]
MDYSRLGIVLGIIVIPVYFWILAGILDLWKIDLAIQDATLALLARYLVAPLFFSIPWILFIYLNKDRMTEAIKHMTATTTAIPVRWRIFYGFNTLIVLLFFALPFFSPVLAIVGAAILAGRIYFAAEFIKGKRRRVKVLFLFLLLFVCGALPTVLLYNLVETYVGVLGSIWGAWVDYVPYIYAFSLCLGDALSVGSLLWFIYAGAAEFEFEAYGTYVTKPPAKIIRLFEAAVFSLFLYVGLLPYIQIPQIGWTPVVTDFNSSLLFFPINPICLAIVGIIFLISTFKGLRRGGERNSAWGLIFLIGFFSIELFIHLSWAYLTIALLGATLLFLLIFFISFRKVGRTW